MNDVVDPLYGFPIRIACHKSPLTIFKGFFTP